MQHFYSTNFITSRPTKKVAKNFAMTDFSSSSVPQIKPDKISDDIAKISIKSEKTTILGNYYTLESIFPITLASLSTKRWGLMGTLFT